MPGQTLTIDARGMRCPWPALRLARAAREGAERVELIADDPAVAGEVAALCAERGWPLEAAAPRFVVTMPPGSPTSSASR